MDNSQFHCWPADASANRTDTLAQNGDHCQGRAAVFLSYHRHRVRVQVYISIGFNLRRNKVNDRLGPVRLTSSVSVVQDVPFNVSYSIDLPPQFFDWAIHQRSQPLYPFVVLSGRVVSRTHRSFFAEQSDESNAEQQRSLAPLVQHPRADARRIRSQHQLRCLSVAHQRSRLRDRTYNALLRPVVRNHPLLSSIIVRVFHRGFHRADRSIIAPSWLDLLAEVIDHCNDELIAMIELVRVVYNSTVVVPVFGTVEIIAHFKIGTLHWIHIALVSSNVQVSRRAGQHSFVLTRCVSH